MAYYVLSESDKQAIQDLLSAKRSRRTPSRTQHPNETSQSPEVYIARTPHDGIAALVLEPGTGSFQENDQPGYADCTIYQVTGEDSVPTLQQTAAIDKRVYNLSTSDIAGDTWVIAVRDKFGVWCAVQPVAGSTGCKAFYNPCTGKTDYVWFYNGVAVFKDEPCPECEDVPEDTGTGTGTGTTDTPVVTLACGEFDAITIPVELCLAMGVTLGGVPGIASWIGCETTFSKLVRLILQPAESTTTALVYKGSIVAAPGSEEAGAFDPYPSGLYPGVTNQGCHAEFTLTISCYSNSSTGLVAVLAGNLGWRNLDLQGFDGGVIGGGTDTAIMGQIWIYPSDDPADWGGNTNLVFTQITPIAGNIDKFTVTAGPCVPCPHPPFVQTNTYSITGTTAYVLIEGDFPEATLSNTTVDFNLGAAGVVTAINSARTQLTVVFTTRPTSTGALTAVVTVNDCCNSGPGHLASEDADEDEGGIDIIVPLVIATPFDIGGV